MSEETVFEHGLYTMNFSEMSHQIYLERITTPLALCTRDSRPAKIIYLK
jgi:hypothetical protein